jgi:hypothetical protein
MLISYRRRFIFVHVPKVAGWSMREALCRYAVRGQRRTLSRQILSRLGWQSSEENPGQRYLESLSLTHHSTAITIRDAVPAEFERFFTFAFVRNPWDWHVSYYHYVRDLPTYATFAAAGCFERYIEEIAPQHALCQKSFVVDTEGHCIVDFVGRFETLHRDYAQVCDRLGIPARLNRINESTHRPYRDYYDARRRRIIQDLHREDCEYFSYSY